MPRQHLFRQLTVESDAGLVVAQFVAALTDVLAIVVGLDVENPELEPELGHGELLTVGDEDVDDVLIIIINRNQTISLHLVPLQVGVRESCKEFIL